MFGEKRRRRWRATLPPLWRGRRFARNFRHKSAPKSGDPMIDVGGDKRAPEPAADSLKSSGSSLRTMGGPNARARTKVDRFTLTRIVRSAWRPVKLYAAIVRPEFSATRANGYACIVRRKSPRYESAPCNKTAGTRGPGSERRA